MKKLLLVLLLLPLLMACEEKVSVSAFKHPDLAGCKLYDIKNPNIYVVRCPAVDTTMVQFSSGKTTKRVITVDGVEYEQKTP